MSRIIRLHQKSDLIEMVKKYLVEELGVPETDIPKVSKLFELLHEMPAATRKEMQGINPYHVMKLAILLLPILIPLFSGQRNGGLSKNH